MDTRKLFKQVDQLAGAYRSFSESTDEGDRQGAEFFRIGSIVLRKAYLGYTEGREDDPQACIAEFREYCNQYVTTGGKQDDLDDKITSAFASLDGGKVGEKSPPTIPALASLDIPDIIERKIEEVFK